MTYYNYLDYISKYKTLTDIDTNTLYFSCDFNQINNFFDKLKVLNFDSYKTINSGVFF